MNTVHKFLGRVNGISFIAANFNHYLCVSERIQPCQVVRLELRHSRSAAESQLASVPHPSYPLLFYAHLISSSVSSFSVSCCLYPRHHRHHCTLITIITGICTQTIITVGKRHHLKSALPSISGFNVPTYVYNGTFTEVQEELWPESSMGAMFAPH